MAAKSSAYPEGVDVVLRGDDNGIPWVGKVQRNIAAKANGAAARVLIHWYYRAHDIAPERLRLLERKHGVKVQPNELFLTSHADENPLASIKQRANVTNVPSSDKVALAHVLAAAPFRCDARPLPQLAPPSPPPSSHYDSVTKR
jgi:hypothetical protein